MSQYLDQLERELYEKCAEIPFENSIYQDEAFVLNTSYTPARAVRNVGLKLSAKVRALRELEFSLERMKIDLDEIKVKLAHRDLTAFDMRRLDVDRRQKLSGISYTEKLCRDALVEVEYLRAVLAKLPTLTRAEFEAQERSYFQQSLGRQCMGMPEAAKSLEAMGERLVLPEGVAKSGHEQLPLVSEMLGISIDGFLKESLLSTDNEAKRMLTGKGE